METIIFSLIPSNFPPELECGSEINSMNDTLTYKVGANEKYCAAQREYAQWFILVTMVVSSHRG